MITKLRNTLLVLAALLFALPAFAETCIVTEYANLAIDNNGNPIYIQQEPYEASDSVTFTSTSTAYGAAFGASTRFLLVHCDGASHYRVMPTSTDADTNDPLIPANQWVWIGVAPGSFIEFIENA